MPEIRTVAVIGAGIMGRGIAHAAALGGYRTILEDILPTTLRTRWRTEIRANLDKAVELGKVTPRDADAAFDRVEYASSVDARRPRRRPHHRSRSRGDGVENRDLHPARQILPPRRPFSPPIPRSLSVTEIASVTYRAPKCVGMHFFNPVHKMKLLEIVRPSRRTKTRLHRRRSWPPHEQRSGRNQGIARIHHQPHQRLIGNEAFYMLQEGMASAATSTKPLKLG